MLRIFFTRFLNIIKYILNDKSIFWFQGKYDSWEHAVANTDGYSNAVIFEKVKESALKVKNGEALFERDSCCFDLEEFSFPLSTYLLYIASRFQSSLSIIDVGGSLGSTYFQHKRLFQYLNNLKWHIIEQKHYVEFGRNELENKVLKFSENLSESLKNTKFDAVLFSASLQYFEHWKIFIENVVNAKVEFIILDRIPILQSKNKSFVTIQYVPAYIYDVSYPCHLFSQNDLDECLLNKYEKVFELPAMDHLRLKGVPLQYKSILYRRKF
ncbi:methyltransferase, TIGR04325 family [Leptospira bandrabouensis]|uniref:methyltransferase, TIGR04325 family n=1 Tax=Leptospira bandrabouensis TaxID=2484903 RepID=UPI001EEC275E|nr:methyltransferase, TIGR04325 family [Leptospira bandrabouensis]MCG6152932.1 methyltransferase, TIGR04325 family [Leptospira bandrabouensis]MCW7478160.1 methyltransferase, TIGR04325 family [Leptospira bandrabouensis]MCW7485718.1 methyltransferase, TIGR04325 family [Leptospira bandrabouensis]